MKGRKPLHDLTNLEIGSKMQLFGKAKKWADQYVYNFNERETEVAAGRRYKKVVEGQKVFVERIA